MSFTVANASNSSNQKIPPISISTEPIAVSITLCNDSSEHYCETPNTYQAYFGFDDFGLNIPDFHPDNSLLKYRYLFLDFSLYSHRKRNQNGRNRRARVGRWG